MKGSAEIVSTYYWACARFCYGHATILTPIFKAGFAMKETLQIWRVQQKSRVPQARAVFNNGSVLTFGLPAQNNAWAVKNRFDDIKPEWLVQKSGLRRLQRNDTISAESLFLLLGRVRELCSQGGFIHSFNGKRHSAANKRNSFGAFLWKSCDEQGFFVTFPQRLSSFYSSPPEVLFQ